MLCLLFLTWKFSLKAKIDCYMYMYVQHMLSYLFTWYDPMFYFILTMTLTQGAWY